MNNNVTHTNNRPRTPAQWRKELFQAGQAVINVQLKGEDATEAMKVYKEVEEALPQDVKKALAGGSNTENYVKLLKAGWSFVKELLELKAKFL